MSEWQRVRLGAIAAKVTVGFVGSMTAEYRDSGIPFLRSLNVRPHRLDMSEIRYVSQGFHQRLRKSSLHPGDVVIVRTGKPGQAAVVPEWLPESNCSDLVIVRPGPRLNSRWLSYYLNWIADSTIASHLVGAVQQHFNVKAAESIELTLPTLPEQEAIGNMLGSLDEKVAANEKVRLLVDDLLQAKFGRLCQGRGRAALRDIADVNAIAVKPQPGSNLRYLDISSVQQGFYVGPEETPWDSAPGRARRALRFGDTVWSTVRPNRRSHALILEDDPLLVASTGLAVLSPRPGRVAGTYEASRRDVFASYLESVAEGSAYPAVRGDRFEAAPIPNITTAEWESFERMALPLRMRVHAAEIESRVLMKARDELLPLLMSGRVKVREAERVASEVL